MIRGKELRESLASSTSMAEPNPPLHPSKPPAPKFAPPNPKDQQTSTKFLSSFLFKTIFIALLPLFPSQAPDFINQSIFTRSWELLHLLIVGIAISYGLFSHRRTEPELEREAARKVDSPQSYISQVLHVSPVFDEEEVDESKTQTWSLQYYRNNPVVVVKKNGTNAGQAANKPLYLPVRSLKSCAQDSGLVNGIALNSTNEPKGSPVLPSPIPWRSRSGRMEVKDELASGTGTSPPASRSPPPFISAGPSKIPSFRSPVTRTPSSTPPPKRPSPSSTLSPEMRAKSSKSFYKPTPPPPPPPPPPFPGHPYKKVAAKSFKDELKDLSRMGKGGFQSTNDSCFDSLMSTTNPRNDAESSSVVRSVRTVRQNAMPDRATKAAGAEQSFGYEARQPPLAQSYQAEKKNGFMEEVIVCSEGSDSDDDASESPDREEVSNTVAEAGPDENEVDRKADEFIAKFREQIRLQRIESIKLSSGQRSLRNPK